MCAELDISLMTESRMYCECCKLVPSVNRVRFRLGFMSRLMVLPKIRSTLRTLCGATRWWHPARRLERSSTPARKLVVWWTRPSPVWRSDRTWDSWHVCVLTSGQFCIRQLFICVLVKEELFFTVDESKSYICPLLQLETVTSELVIRSGKQFSFQIMKEQQLHSGVGREFQVDGPATAKLLGPYRSVLVAGTARSRGSVERRWRRPALSATGWHMVDR